MTVLQQLQAVAAALADIVAGTAAATTALNNFIIFLNSTP
jgi:hypothetical protein